MMSGRWSMFWKSKKKYFGYSTTEQKYFGIINYIIKQHITIVKCQPKKKKVLRNERDGKAKITVYQMWKNKS
jgi:predicted DNA-binding protein (MmcQ/YjbR family)